MPLARVALYQKGITIYISPNTNDNPEWQATIQHIAIEGKCYFVNADMIVRRVRAARYDVVTAVARLRVREVIGEVYVLHVVHIAGLGLYRDVFSVVSDAYRDVGDSSVVQRCSCFYIHLNCPLSRR